MLGQSFTWSDNHHMHGQDGLTTTSIAKTKNLIIPNNTIWWYTSTNSCVTQVNAYHKQYYYISSTEHLHCTSVPLKSFYQQHLEHDFQKVLTGIYLLAINLKRMTIPDFNAYHNENGWKFFLKNNKNKHI